MNDVLEIWLLVGGGLLYVIAATIYYRSKKEQRENRIQGMVTITKEQHSYFRGMQYLLRETAYSDNTITLMSDDENYIRGAQETAMLLRQIIEERDANIVEKIRETEPPQKAHRRIRLPQRSEE